MNKEEKRDREITRHAMEICLSHPVTCECQGCHDIYKRLRYEVVHTAMGPNYPIQSQIVPK